MLGTQTAASMVGRRVYVTAVNMITSLGLDLETSWRALVAGQSGIRKISLFDASAYQTQIAGELPAGFDEYARHYCSRRLARQMARATVMGYVCARKAIESSSIDFKNLDRTRCAVIFGTADTGHSKIYDNSYWVLKTMQHSTPALLSMEYGLEGQSMSLTAACASAAYAIGCGYDLITSNKADVVITGGASAIVNPEHVSGFNELGALSVSNDPPELASRPFSKGRNGFVIGEGAGVVMLESEASARARGATILAELVGYATTNEAYNIMGPAPGGAGMAKTMRLALQGTGIACDEVDYINAHGTSTPLNDKFETLAIKDVFGARAHAIPVSSAKSMIGHTAGACGAVEAVITVLSLQHGIITPTLNFCRDPELDLDYVPDIARKKSIQVALSNSFGFGGCNASLVLRKHPELQLSATGESGHE